MASLDLWIDGDFAQESMAWSQEVALDLDRLHYDEDYAARVHEHIKTRLMYLAKELEEIGIYTKRGDDVENPWVSDRGD